jgi:hypothetical protein
LEEEVEWEDEDPLYVRRAVLAVFTLFLAAQVAHNPFAPLPGELPAPPLIKIASVSTASQVMLVMKLDGGLSGTPWTLVLVPYFLFECAQLGGEAWARVQALKEALRCEQAAKTKVATPLHATTTTWRGGGRIERRAKVAWFV